MKKRNSNYYENQKNNMGKIKHNVLLMLNEKINTQPHDYVSTFNGEAYPKTNHKVLKVPGKFRNLISIRGHTEDGKHKYMDVMEEIEPDGKEVTKSSMGNIEYYTYVIDYEEIYDYDLTSTIKYRKRVFHVAVVNYDPGVEETIEEVSGHPIKVYFRVFDKKRIWKVLNNLKTKDYTKEEMTEFEYIEFAHCIANATRPYAKEYLEECVDFFTTIEKIHPNYQRNLHLSLKVMIKSEFSDDYEKTEELLTMITQALPIEVVKPIASYEDAINQTRELKIEVNNLNDTVEKKDETIYHISTKLTQKDDTINEQKTTIKQKDTELAQKDDTINEQKTTIKQKDELIAKLKKELELKK